LGAVAELCLWHVLLRVESQERQIEEDGEPVAIDDKQEGQEGVDGGFGDDVGVEAVAQVDRVDVVTEKGRRVLVRPSDSRQSFRRAPKGEKQRDSPFQIAVHDGEEHLKEEVDSVDQHRQQVEPGLAGHDGHDIDSSRGLEGLYLNSEQGDQGRSKRGWCWASRERESRVGN